MNNILLALIALSISAIAAFLIPVLIELKRTIVSVRKTAENNLNPTLEEMLQVLKNVNGISANVNDVTGHVKDFSKSISDIGHTVSTVNTLVEKAGASTAVKVISFRAGIKAAIEYLLTNLIKKGDRK